MQRQCEDGIVIACDFCGTDWDDQLPMIEGHRGSVICLPCLQQAIDATAPAASAFTCTLCLQDLDAADRRWQPAGPGGSPDAAICQACIEQATRAFDRDPDVDFHAPRSDAGSDASDPTT